MARRRAPKGKKVSAGESERSGVRSNGWRDEFSREIGEAFWATGESMMAEDIWVAVIVALAEP